MDDLERRFEALQSGTPSHGQAGQRLIISEPSAVMAEPYSCIIFTPEEADIWYSSEGGRRELSDGEDFFRKQREYFGFNSPREIMTLTPVKNLFQQYYLNSKSEPEKQIIKDTIGRMQRGGGGGLKKKSRKRKSKRRKSKKKKKSKTRRRRR